MRGGRRACIVSTHLDPKLALRPGAVLLRATRLRAACAACLVPPNAEVEAQQALTSLRERVVGDERARAVETGRFEERLKAVQDRSRLLLRVGKLNVSLMGFVQTDVHAHHATSTDELDAAGEPLNEIRFVLRRARLRVVMDYRFLIGAFEIDANTIRGLQVRPQAFEVGVRLLNKSRPDLPYLTLHMGLIRTPFGFEVQQSDRDRLYLERATFAGAMFPGEYDLGVRAIGAWRSIRYAIAGMNGDPIGEKLFPGRDPNRSKDLVLNVGVDHSIGKVRLRASFSAVYGQGFHKGAPAGNNAISWRDANADGILDAGELVGAPGAAAKPSASFERYAVGGDLGLYFDLPRVGTLSLLGELAYGQNMDRNVQIADPVAVGRNLKELGWYVGATQELTPYAAVGLRYDRYDWDRNARDATTGAPITTVSYKNIVATAAARLPGYARLIAEFNHAEKPGGKASDGTPLAIMDNGFILRGEVLF